MRLTKRSRQREGLVATMIRTQVVNRASRSLLRVQRTERRALVIYRSIDRIPGCAAILALTLLALPAPVEAQAIVKVNDDVYFRFGINIAAQADWQQIPNSAGTETIGYQQNLFVRRARLLTGGQVARDVSFFLQLDSSNIGKNKAPGSAFTPAVSVLDALVQWKVATEFQPQAGLFYVPLGRTTLTGSASNLTLIGGPSSFLSSSATQSTTMRDTGFGATGYLLDSRLQYRAGVYQGERQAGSRNAFRYAGRVQYEFFDADLGLLNLGYIYPGTNLGKKKIVAVGIGSDNQGDYHAYTADVFADIPVGAQDKVKGGDAVTGSLSWFHYDGGSRFASLPRQNDYLLEAGFLFASVKLQPFLQLHAQDFSDPASSSKNTRQYEVGMHYYVHGLNLKVSGAYTRLVPKASASPATNQLTFQLQCFYF